MQHGNQPLHRCQSAVRPVVLVVRMMVRWWSGFDLVER
jgi:hypothetical protein